MTEHFAFEVDGEHLTSVIYPAFGALGLTLLLGPGSDGSQRNPFVVAHANALAERGVLVVTYDFPNANRRRNNPRSGERLAACCRAAVKAASECRPRNQLFVGGKSIGARVAGHVLADGAPAAVLGLVALGYPLHGIGASNTHEAHLARLGVPALFVQGTRDPFGTASELDSIAKTLLAPTRVLAIDESDHDLIVPRGHVLTQRENDQWIANEIVRWMELVVAR